MSIDVGLWDVIIFTVVCVGIIAASIWYYELSEGKRDNKFLLFALCLS